jgi:hypothetical protein
MRARMRCDAAVPIFIGSIPYEILISRPLESSWAVISVAIRMGEEIPAQQAADVLVRLVVDRCIVQVLFRTSGSLTAALIGTVYPAPGGAALVKPRRESQQPVLRFDPSAATSFRISDGRAFGPGIFGDYKVSSAISFCYPDNTDVTLLELTPDSRHEVNASDASESPGNRL